MLMYEITACQQLILLEVRHWTGEIHLQLMYYVTTTYKVYMTKTQPPKHQH